MGKNKHKYEKNKHQSIEYSEVSQVSCVLPGGILPPAAGMAGMTSNNPAAPGSIMSIPLTQLPQQPLPLQPQQQQQQQQTHLIVHPQPPQQVLVGGGGGGATGSVLQVASAVPKLIVKFGSGLTPERVESPMGGGVVAAAPVVGGAVATGATPENAAYPPSHHHSADHQDQYQYHHRHKEKKKKKKKDKKKREDKDRHKEDKERGEHRHHHKKKKKREYDSGDGGANTPSSVPPQYYSTQQAQDNILPGNGGLPVGAGGPIIIGHNLHQPSPPKIPKLDPDSDASSTGVGGGISSPKRDLPPARSSCASPQLQKASMFVKVLEHLLAILERKDVSNFFSQPVSDTFAPGYSQIIREPMDFSTMAENIGEGKYENLAQFKRDFELICNNCMVYNTPETVYHRAAKRLLLQGQRLLSSDRLRALADHIPMLKELTPDLLGFDIKTEYPAEMSYEEERDVKRIIEEIRGCIRRPAGRFEAIPDNLTPDQIANRASRAAKEAADRLHSRRPGTKMGYLRQKPDGTTSLAIVTPSSAADVTEKTVTLGQLIGRVKNGASTLQGFKEDRRNCVKAFNPIYYGAFSSYGPAYDSTFANLTKQETELVYSTYGDDVGVAYAESIKNFSKNCEYATFIVDNLLDILTGNEHKKTSKYIEEQKLLRSEETLVKSAFDSNSAGSDNNSKSSNENTSVESASNVDFDSLRSLAKEGIDMSFLESLQAQYTKLPDTRLEKNAVLLESLRDAQHQRLSGPPPQHLGQVTGPSNEEYALSDRVQRNLASLVAETRPKDVFVQSGRS
eukprot:TRINITY_DN2074_c1_g1_i15.p1 TRINITY_DN2074_c1_g1~~TRINITY_DN2074_c1_g1_i15.p1  ORF type:complete len:791 (-),score=230.34 TRINITY_DN2074_c1_g1_i15:368-2740(-)